jgi:hypothetical protein
MTTRALLTCDAVPGHMVIDEVFTMVQFTKRLLVSSDGIDPADLQDALDTLALAAPERANALIGVRVATAAVSVAESQYLYFTYTGTPAVVLEK